MCTHHDDALEVLPFGLIKIEDRELIFKHVVEDCQVQRNQIEDVYPCTSRQEELLALTMGAPGSYVADHGFRLSDDIDIALWFDSWKETFKANPILRTRIIQFGETSLQVVLRDEFTWNVSGTIPNEPIQQAMGFGTPLTRLAVISQHDGWQKFTFTIHHALYDGWSLPLILRQVEEAYRGKRLRSRPFTPFMSYLAQQTLKSSQDLWRSLLSGFEGTPFPSLPFNSYIPNPTTSLQHTFKASGFAVTKSAAIKLAWAVVLSQYTDSNDVIFGVNTSGRDSPVFHKTDIITGPTITTYPFRISLSREMPCLEAMESIHQQSVSTIGAQHLGLQNIGQLGPDAAAACKFQNLLVIHPGSDDNDDTEAPFTILPTDGPNKAFEKYALTLECDLSEASIRARMMFDDNLISSEQARRLLRQFAHVMGLLQNDDSHHRIANLYSLNPEDVSLISQWNKAVPPQVDDLVHRQFSSVCAQRGDMSAVCAWDGDFTYRQLDELSSQLAWHLHSLGAVPETFIPVCLEKTRWVIVAVMAIIKTGAGFVLLDPSFPTERLKVMCNDVQAKIMITSTHQQIPSATQQLITQAIDITDPDSAWRQEPIRTSIPTSCVQPSSPLYCAFTSGSSGRPKGVVIEHVAFCTIAATHIRTGIVTSQSRALQFSSFAFDASITDILFTLLAGGCICIPSEWERREDLPNVVSRMQVNFADMTPSVLRTMAPQDYPTLKKIVLGGEQISIREIQDWGSHVHLWNAYGPAECCVNATMQHSVTATSDLRNVGHSQAGKFWIVNPTDHNELLPIGAVGELIIGGTPVGRGYVNNPVATAAAFITSRPPWLQQFEDNVKGIRLYKTGDLVQYAGDGSLRVIGRKDFQVKIRGQRVEIGEIEGTIEKFFPLAKGAVVELVPGKDETSAKVLTAFIEVHHSSCSVDPCHNANKSVFVAPCRELQRHLTILEGKLSEHLPVYMVPARLLTVHTLPRGRTGKTNRQELKDQAARLSLDELTYLTTRSQHRRLPASSAEEIVLQTCAKALNLPVESIGMDDSFFHLGGDSIIAIRFASQARKRGVVFQIVDIFRSPKLVDLAATASGNKTTQEGFDAQGSQLLLPEPVSREIAAMDIATSPKLALSADDIENILPATGGQILRLHEPCSYYTLHISGVIDPERLRLACQTLVQRHGTLRSVFREHKSGWLQVVLKQLEPGFEQYETDNDLVAFAESICRTDKIPMPPVNIPIMKFFLVQGPDQKSILIMRLCHAQYDGYSFEVLCRELPSLYENLPVGNSVPYLIHLQNWAQAQVNTKALDFWRGYLDGFQMSHIGDITERISIEPIKPYMITTSCEVPSVKPPSGITQATVVKAAWALTLSRLSDTPEDITFGLTSSGRNLDSLATNDIFGLCMNRLPVRVKINSTTSALDLMESIQRQYAETLAFELVEFKNMIPSNVEPVFGSVLTFQNTAAYEGFDLGSATCTPWLPVQTGPLRTRDCVELEMTPGQSTLEIFLGAPNTIWSSDRANEVLRVLCNSILRLTENPGGLLIDVQRRLSFYLLG
ncbi:unnamed protein product [Penicillium glandicola]